MENPLLLPTKDFAIETLRTHGIDSQMIRDGKVTKEDFEKCGLSDLFVQRLLAARRIRGESLLHPLPIHRSFTPSPFSEMKFSSWVSDKMKPKDSEKGKDKQKLIEKNENLKKDLRKYTDEVTEMTKRNTSLQEQNENLKTENESLNSQILIMNNRIHELEDEMHLLYSQNVRLQSENIRLQSENDTLRLSNRCDVRQTQLTKYDSWRRLSGNSCGDRIRDGLNEIQKSNFEMNDPIVIPVIERPLTPLKTSYDLYVANDDKKEGSCGGGGGGGGGGSGSGGGEVADLNQRSEKTKENDKKEKKKRKMKQK
jgi:hypothetical protein